MKESRRFACTRCGLCCDRTPEVELGEAAALADVFVWQMMFRIYTLPAHRAGDRPTSGDQARAAQHLQTRRLLDKFAATSWREKPSRSGHSNVERTVYLAISALAYDPGQHRCTALADNGCAIYARRPLSCRSVPLHYSRAASLATETLDRFIANPGYRCDTGGSSPELIADGAIVDPAILEAREAASRQADRDRRWKKALVKAMRSQDTGLPSIQQVTAAADRGALAVPLMIGWQVAVAANLIDGAELTRLASLQVAALDRLLSLPDLAHSARSELVELRRDYEGGLSSASAINRRVLATP